MPNKNKTQKGAMYAMKSEKSKGMSKEVDHSKMSKEEHAAYLKEKASKKKRAIMRRKSREAY